MSQPTLLQLTETDYLQMEEALSSTARGRAFLRMRDQRTRAVGIDGFQRVAARLEEQVDRLVGGGTIPANAQRGGGDELRQELSVLSQQLHQTRGDIQALRPVDSGANRIEAATGELDAIVAATERATTDILNAAEHIQEWTARLPRDNEEMAEIADAIEAWCIEILTACSFQDITGQRTTKVVNTLKYIEQRVNTMIEIWGVDRTISMSELTSGGDGFGGSHRKMNDDRPDAHLLNGPSLGDGVDQNAIDSLFESLAGEMPGLLDRVEPTSPPEPPAPASAPTLAPVPASVPAPVKSKAKGGGAKPSAPTGKGGGGGDDGGGNSQSDIDKLFA